MSTFFPLFGFFLGTFLIARYRLWKARRESIPMQLNPKTGRYEADLKLRRWEKRAKIALWAWIAMCFVAAGAWGVMLGGTSIPQ